MDLREFLFRKNMSRRELSDVLGVCYQSVCNWYRGKTSPNLAQAKKIMEYSKGLITLEDLYGKKVGLKGENNDG